VLLHEGLGSIELWRDFPPQLAAATGRAVVAYSRCGHGRSDVLAEARTVDYMHDEPLTIGSIARAREAAANGDLVAKLGRYHADAAATFRGWNDIWLQPDFLHWDITALLPGITAPILVLQGHDDEYGTAAQLAAISSALPHTATLQLNECGHSPHRSQTATVLERTRALLHARP
jgi:pimeloyl-ACP methyl ester carboxylesterase